MKKNLKKNKQQGKTEHTEHYKKGKDKEKDSDVIRIKRIGKEILKQMIVKSLGNISTVAQIFGKSRTTIYGYIERWNLNQDVEDAREIVLDMAENQLVKLIESKEPSAIFFFLKTQGKKRGYIEKQEFAHSGFIGKNYRETLSLEELNEIINGTNNKRKNNGDNK